MTATTTQSVLDIEQAVDGASRKRLWRSMLILGVSGIAGGVLLVSALFTQTADVPNNVFSSGDVDISTSPDTTLLTMSNGAPGDRVSAPLTVSNDGSLELRYSVTSLTTGSAELAAQLDLTILKSSMACSTPAEFDAAYAAADPADVLYDGGVLGTHVTATNVVGDPTAGSDAGDRTLAAAANEVLCFSVLFPSGSGNEFETLSTTAEFAFISEQTKNNA
jgi:hypothetical protein